MSKKRNMTRVMKKIVVIIFFASFTFDSSPCAVIYLTPHRIKASTIPVPRIYAAILAALIRNSSICEPKFCCCAI